VILDSNCRWFTRIPAGGFIDERPLEDGEVQDPFARRIKELIKQNDELKDAIEDLLAWHGEPLIRYQAQWDSAVATAKKLVEGK